MLLKAFFLILFLFFNTNTLFAKDEVFFLEKCFFIGINRVSSNYLQLSSCLSLHIGTLINKNDISNIIRCIFDTGNFDKISVYRRNNTLIIKVKERPIIRNVIFCGNKNLASNNLKKYLQYKKIKSGCILDKKILFEVQRNIKNFYFSIGKYNINVNIKLIYFHDYVDIKLNLYEGPYSKVYNINILGNKCFPNHELISIFKLRYTSFLGLCFYSKYSKHRLLQDINSLRNYYVDNGFINFKINSVCIKFNKNKDRVYITFNIVEGVRYKLFNFFLQGQIPYICKEKIKKIIGLNIGEFYSYKKINILKNKICALMNCHGYINSCVVINNMFNKRDCNLTLRVNINTGNQFYVRYIKFNGNNNIKDIFLRRRITQIEGDVFNRNLVNKDKLSLSNLGYFSKVNVIVKPTLKCNQLDILYDVKEKSANSVNFDVSFNDIYNINFCSNLRKRNWLGKGNSLSLQYLKSIRKSHTELSIGNYLFLIKNLNIGSQFFFNNINNIKTNLLQYNLIDYGLDVNCTLFSFCKRIKLSLNYVNSNLKYLFSQFSVLNYLIDINMIENDYLSVFDLKNIDFIFDDVLLILNACFDKLNKPLLSQLGYKIDLLEAITLFGSSNKYYKFIFNINHYIPISLNNNLIYKHHIYMGYMNRIGKQEVPFYENFYFNNKNLIRGLRVNTVGPRDISFSRNTIYPLNYNNDENCTFSSNIIGGNMIFISNMELSLPIPFIKSKYNNIIRISLFFDIGNLWNNIYDINNKKNIFSSEFLNKYSCNFSNFRYSGGVVFRWSSPFGPLSISYAYPIKKCINDKNEKFQFSIGKEY